MVHTSTKYHSLFHDRMPSKDAFHSPFFMGNYRIHYYFSIFVQQHYGCFAYLHVIQIHTIHCNGWEKRKRGRACGLDANSFILPSSQHIRSCVHVGVLFVTLIYLYKVQLGRYVFLLSYQTKNDR